MSEVTPAPSFPWQPQSTITGNLAIGNLRENLLVLLRDQQGVHTETLMTAMGALAGFAAQNAALAAAAELTINGVALGDGLVIAGTESGEQFLLGDMINVFLYSNPQNQLSLEALIGGAALQTNLIKQKDLPNTSEIAKHVVETIGHPNFGNLRAPIGNKPMFQPVELATKLWSKAVEIIKIPLPRSMSANSEPPLNEKHWPIVMSIVASQFVGLAKDALNPRLSCALVMEAAAITAKINPESIEPGKWRFEFSEGKLKVTRCLH